jgi:hypothetical protein
MIKHSGIHPGHEEGPADSFNGAVPAISYHILGTGDWRDVGGEEDGVIHLVVKTSWLRGVEIFKKKCPKLSYRSFVRSKRVFHLLDTLL